MLQLMNAFLILLGTKVYTVLIMKDAKKKRILCKYLKYSHISM